jgi:hypothetical protein
MAARRTLVGAGGRFQALRWLGRLGVRFSGVASRWVRTGMTLAALMVPAGLASAGDAGETIQVALAPTDSAAVDIAAPPRIMVARVDLSDQTMNVYVDDVLAYTFVVSTGRKGHATPVGRYKAEWLSPKHRSRKYNNAPMPWSVFFYDGYAVHGTTEMNALGRPASHGCVRLDPENAKAFYALVKELGLENTIITIVR